MVLPIRWYGDPVLRDVAGQVDGTDGRLDQLVRDMVETMIEGDGIGLAAPQVGRSIRLIVLNGSVFDEEGASVYLNPEIVEESSSRTVYEEGCLSLPDIRADVERAEAVLVRFTTLDGKVMEEEVDGLGARVFQHEIDHLNGKLFIDHLGAARLVLLQKRLREIKRKNAARKL